MEGALDVIRAPEFANWILFKAGLSLLQGPGGASALMVTAEDASKSSRRTLPGWVLGEAWESLTLEEAEKKWSVSSIHNKCSKKGGGRG